jgi:hypothetical protein
VLCSRYKCHARFSGLVAVDFVLANKENWTRLKKASILSLSNVENKELNLDTISQER